MCWDLEQPNYFNSTTPPQLAILPAHETRVGDTDQDIGGSVVNMGGGGR